MLISKNAPAAAFICLLGICLYDDARLFTRPRENWRAAAVKMKRLSAPGTCLVFVPTSSLSLYLVFEKTLASYQCADHTLQTNSRVVLATSPYADSMAVASEMKMISLSFTEERRTNMQEPFVTIYNRK